MLYVADEIVTPGAGTEGQLLRLIEGLSASRYEPHLAVLRSSEFVASGAVPCPVHVLAIDSLAAPASVPKFIALSRLVRRLTAAVAHIYFNDAAIVAPALCRLGGARTVSSRRDMGFWYSPAVIAALRAGNTCVDVMVANSLAVRTNVHLRERFPLDRIAVVDNGHPLERFASPPEPGLRERLAIAPDDVIVGMVANLNARKRHADLLDAVARMRRDGLGVHAVLVGSGPERTALAARATALDMSGVVHFVEGVTDVVPLVKHFDVAVLCSESEGFSNAILEYALCARAIVCSNVGGNPEFIESGKTGFLLEVGDVTGLASTITALLRDPTMARSVGVRAESAARQRFSLDAMIASHLSLYDQLLTSGRRVALPPPRFR